MAGGGVSPAAAMVLADEHPPPSATVAAAAVLGVVPIAAALLSVLRRRPRFTTAADRVTLARAVLACGCAAMTALVVLGPAPARTGWLFGLSVPTLLLDAVDGRVARRTGCATPEGARLDMQTDAVVLAVLSIAVATELGWWALLVGAMRYLYVAAGWIRPGLDAPLPRNRFRVAVAAVQAAALATALAPFVPIGVATGAVAVALALLVASFGSQVVEIERGGSAPP